VSGRRASVSLVGGIKRSESTIHAIIVGGYGAKPSAFIHPTHTDPIIGYKKSGMLPKNIGPLFQHFIHAAAAVSFNIEGNIFIAYFLEFVN